MPITLSLLGRDYSEPTLLGLAYSYEQATMLRSPSLLVPPLPGEEFEYEPVPEPPATIALTVVGFAVLGLKLRRHRRSKGKLEPQFNVSPSEAASSKDNNTSTSLVVLKY